MPSPASEASAWSITGSTALVGVLGDPVRHSLSPTMHNAALRCLGLDWVYLALPCPAAELATVLQALERLDCRGLNLTLPHKQAAAALAQELSPLAGRLGAVNTLVRRPAGGWWGTNTDVEGFLAPLRQDGQRWHGERALVLGCGGSARAVLAGLLELGLAEIAIAGRTSGRLQELLDCGRRWQLELGGDAAQTQLSGVRWHGAAWQGGAGADAAAQQRQADGELEAVLRRCRLLVHTTPVGMASADDAQASERSPLDPQQLDLLPPQCTVYDLIYTPRPTALLRQAALRGQRGLDGLEMLVQQGAASLRLWCGRRDVPVTRMREAALARLAAA